MEWLFQSWNSPFNPHSLVPPQWEGEYFCRRRQLDYIFHRLPDWFHALLEDSVSGDCSQLLQCPWLINFVLWLHALESQFACILPMTIHSLFLLGNHTEASSGKLSYRCYMNIKLYDSSATKVFLVSKRWTRAWSLSAFTAAVEQKAEGSFLQPVLFICTELMQPHILRV